MVTFEQLLVKYLYQHKQISIQGFGTVTLNNTIPDLDLIHKNRQMPVEGATFIYNAKVPTEENFIVFFAQQRGKIRPLAISDIESYLQLAKQLMNIGKPYEIEGLGMFSMQKDGTVVLIPGHYAVPLPDNSGQPNKLRERTEQQEKTEAETTSGGLGAKARKALLAAGILIALLAAVWFIWSKFVTGKVADNGTTLVVPAQDTNQLGQDTLLQDSTVATPLPAVTDTVLWRVYFRSFTGKEQVGSMIKMYNRYRTVMAETTDSVNFRLYTLVRSPIADTTTKIDSLSKVFLKPVTLEKANP